MARLFLRRFILVTVLASALAAACGVDAGAQDARIAFVSGIEDLPLMPGLEEVDETTMVFDTPAGRIVEASASLGRSAAPKWYASMPPLCPNWAGRRPARPSFAARAKSWSCTLPTPRSGPGT